MSLLHQEQKDDAARGDELTKGTSHVVWASIIAVIVVSAAIALYFIAGQKPPLATGQVLGVWAHTLHVQTPNTDASGAVMPSESFDQVLVFTQVRIHNQSQQPLFMWNIATNVSLADGIHTSYAANASDFGRVFVAYPGLTVPHGKPLSLETEIDPGQTVEGEIVSAFKITKQQWDARKDLNFTFAFRYQPNLVLKPTVPVIDQ